jgi:hypothetical protein
MRYFLGTWSRSSQRALAVAVVCAGPAFAAVPFTCIATAVPTLVRSEGVAELVGDVVLDCGGGIPTAAGAPVPRFNVQVFLNTNITSRILEAPFNEALLLIDEPAEANQRVCTPGPCIPLGTGLAGGVNYSGPFSPEKNVYQGQQALFNSVAFLGVPIDALGDTGRRTLRITNIRANASLLGISSFATQQIQMNISLGAGNAIQLLNPQVIVAFSHAGLVVSRVAVDRKNVQRQVPDNESIPLGPCTGNQEFILVRFQEAFADAFQPMGQFPAGSTYDPALPVTISVNPQAKPGLAYYTESGFYNPAFPSARGLNRAGLADRGTRLSVRFTLPAGVRVGADSAERNFSPSRAAIVDIVTEGNTTTITWEILTSDPFALETLDFTVGVAGTNEITDGAGKMGWGFAPLSTVPTASDTAPIPRFVMSAGSVTAFVWYPCYSSLMFPFVSNQGGNDTAFVISNTSLDPFGTAQVGGTCNVHYYGTSPTGKPETQTTGVIEPGKQLTFTLGSGGTPGVKAAPGFQGYVIVTCRFPYIHGFAAFADAAAQHVSYLGIVLDVPGLNRTTQLGEVGGH